MRKSAAEFTIQASADNVVSQRMGFKRTGQLYKFARDVLRPWRHQSGLGCSDHSHAIPDSQALAT